jgi:hypothetical protein
VADNWYDIVNDIVNQGDILIDFPIITSEQPTSFRELKEAIDKFEELVKSGKNPEELGPLVKANVKIANAVVLTQGCLIAGPNGPKVDQVVIAVIDDVKGDEWGFVKDVIKGNRPPYHLLGKSFEPSIPLSYQIVDFTQIFSVSYKLLDSFCKENGSRLRLKSPYVEELSQRFGLFYSKVGLPNNTIDEADLRSAL